MFDKYGEFDSAKELNAAAEGQKAEGDLEALIELAAENGIDKEDAEDYYDGATEELATPIMAAFGKLEVEAAKLKPTEIMSDWFEYIKKECVENEDMAAAVRKKGKSLSGCIAHILAWSFKNMYDIPPEIKKAAQVTGNVKMGIPGVGQAKRLIWEYYLEADA